ncbi:MAG: hypothetical protein QOG04_2199 [Actinomycetota bacterium]|jgi:hypothetical protein|nr:hypothetical protein [Actinomycetota bacterium]
MKRCASMEGACYSCVDVDRAPIYDEQMDIIKTWVLFVPYLQRFDRSVDR